MWASMPASGGDTRPQRDERTADGEVDDSILRAVADAPVIALAQPRLAEGTLVDGTYRVVRTIGAGGMGVVYEAIDLVLHRSVALKVHDTLRSEHADRMWREARAMARLNHPNVVTVHEVGTHDGRVFIAMELVHGSNARDWVRRGERSWREIVEVYLQAARGLAAAHAVGIVHRDFKPDNVLVGADGRVRVGDFGLARDAAMSTTALADIASVPEHALTKTGATMGTPAYMAPEQARGGVVDARSDQFAFCVALYEALYGHRPFAGDTLGEVLENAANHRVQPPTRGAPRRLFETIVRGLAPDPDDRHRDMVSLAHALQESGGSRGWLLGAGAVAAIGVGALWISRDDPCAGVDAPVRETWNAQRAAALEQAFVRTDFAGASSAAKRVAAGLDAWVGAWARQRREACEAARVRAELGEARLELRIDCLERARRRTTLLVDALVQADTNAVVRADEAIDGLPRLEVCEDALALAELEPIAPEDRRDAEALRQRMEAIGLALALGRGDSEREALDAVVRDAEATGYAVLAGEARRLRGALAFADRRRAEAEEDFASAVALASRSGDTDLAVDAMIGVARSRASSDTVESLRWLATAEALAERHGWARDRIAEVELARAEVSFVGDRPIDAETSARRALAAAPEGTRLHADALNVLGSALFHQRRLSEAVEVHREAIALAERVRGTEHPAVAVPLASLAVALEELGRLDEALEAARRGLALRRAAYGEDAPIVASSLMRIAETLRLRGELAASYDAYERALAIYEARRPHEDEAWIMTASNMVSLLGDMGELQRAKELIDTALPLAHRVFGEDSLRVGELAQTRATLERNIGDPQLAIAYGLDAVRLLERHLGATHPRIASAYIALASAYGDRGEYEQALRMLDKAAPITAGAADVQPREHAFALIIRAEILRAMDRKDEALEQCANALVAFEALYPKGSVELAHALAFHGELLLAAGRADEAAGALERALAMIGEQPVDPDLRASIEGALAETRKSLRSVRHTAGQ